MVDKALIWGAMPFEHDGGAIVTAYQLEQMNDLDPEFQMHVVPKVYQQAAPNEFPYLYWHQVTTKYFGQIPSGISRIMKKNDIKLLILWHIPWEYFSIVDRVHRFGGKVVNWQTIHWKNDVLFMSDKLHDFDWWVPPTEYAKKTLIEMGGLSAKNMTVIPHGVPTNKFFPRTTHWRDRNIPEGKKMILFVGRCQFTKGIVSTLLTARKLAHDFDCHIVFKAGVHEGVYKSKEIAYLLGKMTKWDKRITFMPQWTSPDFIEDLIASCDILLCPSGHEGFSLPPLEAMACRKPVCITDIPVHRELVGGRSGSCGLLMPPSVRTEYVNDTQIVKVPKADMIYGSLKFLLENPDEAEAMGKRGYQRARKYYSLKKISQDWLKLLRRL